MRVRLIDLHRPASMGGAYTPNLIEPAITRLSIISLVRELKRADLITNGSESCSIAGGCGHQTIRGIHWEENGIASCPSGLRTTIVGCSMGSRRQKVWCSSGGQSNGRLDRPVQ